MFKLNGRLGRLLLNSSIIAADDPVTCAAYAKENDLLVLEGWRRFRSLAKKDEVLARPIKQSKIREVRRSHTYILGTSYPETTWRPCNLTLKTKIVLSLVRNSGYTSFHIKKFPR